MKALKAANNWMNPTMASYLTAITLHIGIELGGVCSVSWGGTRLSGMDVLFSTMLVHGKAFWCPPIVPRWSANDRSGLCTCHTYLKLSFQLKRFAVKLERICTLIFKAFIHGIRLIFAHNLVVSMQKIVI